MGHWDGKIHLMTSFFFLLFDITLVFWLRLGNSFVSQSPRTVIGQFLVCVYTICQHGWILISCTIPSVSHSHPIMPTIVFLLCQFTAFTYVINFFISVAKNLFFCVLQSWEKSCSKFCYQVLSNVLIDYFQGDFFVCIVCFWIAWVQYLFCWKSLLSLEVL